MIVSKFGCSDNQILFSSLVNDIFDYVASLDLANLEPGRYGIEHLSDDEAFFMVQENETVENCVSGPEFHRKFTDVHFLISGVEKVGWEVLNDREQLAMHQVAHFSEKQDTGFVEDYSPEMMNFTVMKPGMLYVFTPSTIHIPNLAVNGNARVKKVVIKIESSLLSDSYSIQPLSMNTSENMTWCFN